MSGRICEIHGEWCPTGVCQWCEPAPLPLPEGHTRCRCGWIAWTEYAPRPFREEYDGMMHSPEQCYATAATPPAEPLTYMGVPVVLDDSAPALSDAIPVLVSWTLTEKTEEAYCWRVEWTTPAVVPDEMNAAKEADLLAQHAALRWERVARKWAHKHGPWTMRDLAQLWQQQFDKMVALQLKRLEETLHPLLAVPKSEPKP